MDKKIYQLAFDHIPYNDNYTEEEKLDIIKECINGGVDINSGNLFVIQESIHANHVTIVKFLLESGSKTKPHFINNALNIGYEMTMLLLDNGFKIDDNTEISNLFSKQKIDIQMINLLIDNKISIDKLLYFACTIISTIKKSKKCKPNFEIIKLLLSYSANINADKKLINYIQINIDLIKLLIDNGLDTSNFDLLLKRSIWEPNFYLAKYLISIGIQCPELEKVHYNVIFENGGYDGGLSFVKLLLENGLNPNGYITDGYSALEFFINSKYYHFCKLFLEFGADINIINNEKNRDKLNMWQNKDWKDLWKYQ